MTRTPTTLILGLALGLPAWADTHHAASGAAMDHSAMDHSTMDHSAVAAKLSEGMVKKVDKAQGKVTIRHGPLENLGMPPMTMVFRVKEPAWLGRMKPGDNIRFLAEQIDGVYTVTRFEPVK